MSGDTAPCGVPLAPQRSLDNAVYIWGSLIPLLLLLDSGRPAGLKARLGARAEVVRRRGDAQFYLKRAGQGVDGAPSGLPVLLDGVESGFIAVCAIQSLLSLQDHLVTHGAFLAGRCSRTEATPSLGVGAGRFRIHYPPVAAVSKDPQRGQVAEAGASPASWRVVCRWDRAPVGRMAHRANPRRRWRADGGSAVGARRALWTDLEPEVNRSRRGTGPILVRGRRGPGGPGIGPTPGRATATVIRRTRAPPRRADAQGRSRAAPTGWGGSGDRRAVTGRLRAAPTGCGPGRRART